jgi:pilus assembly protein CpaB
MKMRGLLLLIISLILGLGAVQWIRRSQAVPQASASVVVARSSLNFGDHIGDTDLQLVKWPADAVPAGTFTHIEDIAGPGQDRVVLRPIEPNEPILAGMISGSGGKASLSTVIDRDMRAVTIHVNDATGVAGFVTPGDRVDILLTQEDNGKKENSKTDLLLQNVLVRGIDQEANERKDKPTVVKAVTVEVTPVDAQKLTLGSNIGTLSLALRNFSSAQEVALRQLSVHDLLPDLTPKAAPGRRSGPLIQIVRGVETTSYDVSHEGAAPAAKRSGS